MEWVDKCGDWGGLLSRTSFLAELALTLACCWFTDLHNKTGVKKVASKRHPQQLVEL